MNPTVIFPRKNYPTNENLYNHIDELWSIDQSDMSDCKISNKKAFCSFFCF